jgi:hypothetical protein
VSSCSLVSTTCPDVQSGNPRISSCVTGAHRSCRAVVAVCVTGEN